MSDSAPRPPQPSNEALQDLLRVAFAAAELAYSPYSKVQVGAALMAADGQVFSGCNVENASFGLTLCAERVAAAKAVSAGVTRFEVMAIASSLDAPMMPCGACRQFLNEFAPGLYLVVQGKQGPRFGARLSELLPHAFGPADLR
ncbi:MAG: cytidine deaminase [Planctomycetes bacterium]|jgi:cytidine deaminase|nr:cytidine deaminase [Planctomycetota bacterium]